MLPYITSFKPLLTEIARGAAFAKTDLPCLITGEKGVGKFHLAKYIHHESPRKDEPFVVLDLAETKNIEVSLFGEVKKSLLMGQNIVSGAIDRAKKGTLLIKNIQLLPTDIQTQLIATIQLGGYRPVGGEESLRSGCRYIFTTVFTPSKLTEEKRLVPELTNLFSRTTFTIPPLRERPNDIEPLTRHFLKKWCDNLDGIDRTLTKQAMKLLKKSKWTGNAASLQQVILNAVLHFKNTEIDARHLQMKLDGNFESYTEAQLEESAIEEIVEKKISQFMQRLGRYDVENLHSAIIERVERPLIKIAMEKASGNQLKAARILGINRNTLRTKLRRLGI